MLNIPQNPARLIEALVACLIAVDDCHDCLWYQQDRLSSLHKRILREAGLKFDKKRGAITYGGKTRAEITDELRKEREAAEARAEAVNLKVEVNL